VTSGSFTPPGQPTITGLPAFCDVAMTQTDPAGNPINIEVWLPRNWNGRFQGIGGGFFCGISYRAIAPTAPGLATGLLAGYATASTDCGHPLPTASFALNPDGTLNRPLITGGHPLRRARQHERRDELHVRPPFLRKARASSRHSSLQRARFRAAEQRMCCGTNASVITLRAMIAAVSR